MSIAASQAVPTFAHPARVTPPPKSTPARRRKSTNDNNTKSEVDIELLIFFHAVAETLSFTKAAQKLNIDQSWLSHKIRQLENTLKVSLFIRNTRHVELTRAGLSLLEPARSLAEFAARARTSAEILADSMEATLTVGALPFSFPDPGRTALLDKFMIANPGTQVVVTNGSTPELLDQLRAGKIDLAFVSAPFDETGLDAILLRENSFCLLLPEEHALARLDDITEEALAGVSVVVPAPHFSPATFDAYYLPLVQAGIKPLMVPEFQNAVAYARDWMLPVACTQFAANRDRRPGLVIRPLPFIPPCRKYLVRLASHKTPSQTTFWDMVTAAPK